MKVSRLLIANVAPHVGPCDVAPHVGPCDRLGAQAEQGIGAIPQHAAVLVHIAASTILRSRERVHPIEGGLLAAGVVGRGPAILVVREPRVRLLLVVVVAVVVVVVISAAIVVVFVTPS